MSDVLKTVLVLDEVAEERERQDEKWGPQHHPDGTGPLEHPVGINNDRLRDLLRTVCNQRSRAGTGTWTQILLEEVFEAMAEEPNSPELRKELVQVAAVCAAWIEDIDSREPCIQPN